MCKSLSYQVPWKSIGLKSFLQASQLGFLRCVAADLESSVMHASHTPFILTQFGWASLEWFGVVCVKCGHIDTMQMITVLGLDIRLRYDIHNVMNIISKIQLYYP